MAKPPTLEDSKLAQAAMNALRQIVRGLRVSSRSVEKAIGISFAQLFVLQELRAHPGASLTDLAALTLTDLSSVSVVVSRLVERGLVSRKPSTVDARRIELRLTAAGRTLLRKAPEPAQARLIRGLQGLPAEQLTTVAHALERLVAGMGIATDSPPMFFEDEPSPAKRPRRARP